MCCCVFCRQHVAAGSCVADCKTREILKNSNFVKNGKTVIYRNSPKKENAIFLDLGSQNGLHRWNRLTKSSTLVEFHQIPRLSEFHVF